MKLSELGHRVVRLGAALALSGGLAIGVDVAQAQAQAQAVRIGVLDYFSSANGAAVGMGSVEAARMAAEDFGGTVLGKPIEIIFADHQGKADLGASIARQWLDTGGVTAIASVPNSSVALAVTHLAKASNAALLLSAAGASELSGKDCSPANTVEWTFDTYALANSTVRALAAEGARTWFFMTADYALGRAFERDATTVIGKTGGKVVGSARVPVDSLDFSSFLLTAQGSKADVVALANAAADTVNSVKQAHEFGVVGSGQKLAALLFDITDVNGLGLPTAQGLYFTNAFYWDRTPESRAWSQRFFARMKKMPSMFQAGTYSAVTHYLKAVQATGTTAGDRVVAQMRQTPVHDMFTDNGRLREDGVMVHDLYLMQVKSPAESKYPWDYNKIIRTIPADEAYRPLSESECPALKAPPATASPAR